ncbi:MAG: sodium:solute symporter [Bacteroidota bacterium]|nr:sodium:solute symporter [Bacteroidota bacterium]MDX5429646.1 sodium:solute symporter [Bacteroidota bacterium]MDX5468427.1 sodium:solute symporter [Bacteroidota bacterium]
MTALDWIVLLGTLGLIIAIGLLRSRGNRTLSGFLKGGNSDNWATVGLSVMATQASAITFLSATGQGFESGVGFAQFYLGLPLAIVIICAVFIPIYFKAQVFTAYEYLEGRFDLKTRLLTASLFLISRAFAAGITIFAPAIVLSTLFGWPLQITNLVIGLLVILYTVSGGSKAVSVTQKQQMTVIFFGMFLAFYLLIRDLPEQIGFSEAMHLAKISDKLNWVNLSFDWNERYTLWSGLLGGIFLFLSYFGTDQSQVQRYISAQNTDQSRLGLLFNALFKIPMQAFILLVGVMVFVFFQFNSSPHYFNEQQWHRALQSDKRDSILLIAQDLERLNDSIQPLAMEAAHGRQEAAYQSVFQQKSELQFTLRSLLQRALPSEKIKDTDYVFLYYVLHYFPPGIIGLLLAVILSAAMSSTSGELSALSSTAMIDFYRRLRTKPIDDEKKEVRITQAITLFWGILAIFFALSASLFENLIQLVNIIGSFFYGTILGIFLCGFFIKKIGGTAVFVAAIIAELVVAICFFTTEISFLWLNPIGTLTVVFTALIFSYLKHE